MSVGFLATLIVLPLCAVAQGGPPLLADDPETPGSGRWENNVALTFIGNGTHQHYAVPFFDLNYGWGPRVQLKFEMPVFIHETSEGRSVTKSGNARMGLKLRFLDESPIGVSLSTYPQFECVTSTPEPEEPRKELLIPVEVAGVIGPLELDGELGYNIVPKFGNEWLYGLVLGHEFSNRLEFLAELYETMREEERTSEMTLNLGSRYQISKNHIILLSVGRSLHQFPGSDPEFSAYAGLQFIIGGGGN